LAEFVEFSPRSFPYFLQPKLVGIVVSVDSSGKPNGMTVAWFMPVSRDPPLMVVAVSPRRYTYSLIKQTRDFTLNILDSSLIGEVEFFGSVSGRDVDKFSKSRLTLSKSKFVKSPYISEAVTILECSLYADYPAGDHQLIIGKVERLLVKKDAASDNIYNLKKIKLLLYLGEGKYTVTSEEVYEYP